MAVNDLIGGVAASLVLASFCSREMLLLRALAIASNLAFVTYAYRAGLMPILVLHAVMLPVNGVRLHQEIAATRPAVTTRQRVEAEPFR
jgi:hypothetical protein